MTNGGGRGYPAGMTKPVKAERDGWVSVELDDDLRAHVHLKRREVEVDGELYNEVFVDGLYLHAEQITTDTLRRVHPGRIAAAAWNNAVDFLVSADRSGATGEDKEVVRAKIRTLVLLGLSIDADDSGLALGALRGRADGRRMSERPREPLGRPGTDLNDFYRRVAGAYNSATAASSRPAAVLAEENNVPVGTVHRWVREARRRGDLPPGRRGVAG